jgi:hypothetical protein
MKKDQAIKILSIVTIIIVILSVIYMMSRKTLNHDKSMPKSIMKKNSAPWGYQKRVNFAVYPNIADPVRAPNFTEFTRMEVSPTVLAI